VPGPNTACRPSYVVAIIGVETRYGGYLGKHRVIDALATLAFDYPRRSKFFTGELESFLIMARDEGWTPSRSHPRAPTPVPWDWTSSCPRAFTAGRWTSTAMVDAICGTR